MNVLIPVKLVMYQFVQLTCLLYKLDLSSISSLLPDAIQNTVTQVFMVFYWHSRLIRGRFQTFLINWIFYVRVQFKKKYLLLFFVLIFLRVFSDAPYYVRGVSINQDVCLPVCVSVHVTFNLELKTIL